MTIPFYGATDHRSFEIERAAMDRPGKVIAALDRLLPPTGTILDIGAGNGFSADRLSVPGRSVVGLEPALGMIDPSHQIPWVRGVAQALPFRDQSFDGAYATWAYFFPAMHDISVGIAELRRVVRPGGPIAIVDNAGDDEFTRMANGDISTDFGFWEANGFMVEVIDTVFAFDSTEDARHLLTLYFGEDVEPRIEIAFRVAVMSQYA